MTLDSNVNGKISSTPMILGIIGSVIGVPAAFCGAACSAAKSMGGGMMDKAMKGDTAGLRDAAEKMANLDPNSETVKAASTNASLALYISLAAVLIGLIGAIMYKKNTKTWGMAMLAAGVLYGIACIWGFNWLSIISALLLLAAGFLSYSNKTATA